MRYMDMGPLDKQPIGFPPHKRPREAAKDANQPFKGHSCCGVDFESLIVRLNHLCLIM